MCHYNQASGGWWHCVRKCFRVARREDPWVVSLVKSSVHSAHIAIHPTPSLAYLGCLDSCVPIAYIWVSYISLHVLSPVISVSVGGLATRYTSCSSVSDTTHQTSHHDHDKICMPNVETPSLLLITRSEMSTNFMPIPPALWLPNDIEFTAGNPGFIQFWVWVYIIKMAALFNR